MNELAARRLQAEVNRRVAEHIPPDGWKATVAIVIANRPAVHLLGTGSLFESVSVKALEFTTYAYAGSTESMLGYDAKYHLLIDSTPRDMTESDGSPAVVVRRDGQLATMPRDLKGISGCAVWAVGDLRVPVERWDEKHPKVVAVETGIYQESHVIRTTRWVAVTTLIHEAFPPLRPALELWESTAVRGSAHPLVEFCHNRASGGLGQWHRYCESASNAPGDHPALVVIRINPHKRACVH